MAQTIDLKKGFAFHELDIPQTERSKVKDILIFIEMFHNKPTFLDATKDQDKFKSISIFIMNVIKYYIDEMPKKECAQATKGQRILITDHDLKANKPGKMVLRSLNLITNLTANEYFCSRFMNDTEFIKFMGQLWFTNGENEPAPLITPSLGSLVNLTHALENSEKFILIYPNAFEDICNALLSFPVGDLILCPGYFHTICNLSRVRQMEKDTFAKLVLYLAGGILMTKESKRSLVGCIKHCLVNTECHKWMIDPEINALPVLLYPLMGVGDEFTDEEYDPMPIELQYLDKPREIDYELRTNLLFCILQLCRTPELRNCLRKINVLCIMRELIKFEQEVAQPDVPNITIIENIVEVLVKEEKEIGPEPDEPFEIPNPIIG